MAHAASFPFAEAVRMAGAKPPQVQQQQQSQPLNQPLLSLLQTHILDDSDLRPGQLEEYATSMVSADIHGRRRSSSMHHAFFADS